QGKCRNASGRRESCLGLPLWRLPLWRLQVRLERLLGLWRLRRLLLVLGLLPLLLEQSPQRRG
ncbi:MAG: hypothetical protein WB689_17345, partial [Xanthobacteraceae bacterium]